MLAVSSAPDKVLDGWTVEGRKGEWRVEDVARLALGVGFIAVVSGRHSRKEE